MGFAGRGAPRPGLRLTVLRDGRADADEEVHRVLLDEFFPRQADVIGVDRRGAVSPWGSLGAGRPWDTHRVRLSNDECWGRVRAADHGVLCTTGTRRTIDAVPVCFAVVSKVIVTPVDLVKPKSTTELGRLKNLERDATATLLCEQWDRQDWSRLWWVRMHLARKSRDEVSDPLLEKCEEALRHKYAQYGDAAFAELVVFDVTSLVGWAAADQGDPHVVAIDPLM